MPDVSVSGLIERSIPTHSVITALVVFPKPESALVPYPLGYFRGVALLQITDGTVWMLQMPGRGWTSNRLKVAAETLSELSGMAPIREDIERELRRNLEVESVTLLEPEIGTFDAGQWGTREIARAVFDRSAPARREATNGGSGIEEQIRAIELSLDGELTAALEAFADQMEPTARAMASENGHIDVTQYNYIAQKSHRKYRQQFAQTFPGLVHAAATAVPGSMGAEIREIIDDGAPVVKELAARWQVRPGVVRYLIGRPTADIGEQWSSNMNELATLLNALRPEDLPGEDAESWDQFNRAVAIGQTIFGKPVWNLGAGLEWLRECVYRINRGTARTASVWLPEREDVNNIGQFRDKLAASLRSDVVVVDVKAEGALNDAIDEAVSGCLFSSASKGLGNIVARFDDELDRLQQEQKPDLASRVVSFDAMWPLIPADYVSKDGSRIVRPLTTRAQLNSHGHKLANCLGGKYTRRYLIKGSRGHVFIVGLFEASMGLPRSTAEIRIRTGRLRLNYEIDVIQHTAFANRKPSMKCMRTMKELIAHLHTPEVHKHLENGWRQIAEARSWRRRVVKVQNDTMVTTALRHALKGGEYDEMLAKVRAMTVAQT